MAITVGSESFMSLYLTLRDAGLSIRLVKASDLPANSCGMSTYDLQTAVGEIDVLRKAGI